MEANDGRRILRLDGVRADGWFEQFATGLPSFRELADVLGERFVAFSVIAGVQVTGITVDRRSPDASLVDFRVGDEAEQRLSLGEFRRRLVAALLADEPPDVSGLEQEAPSPERIQEIIGIRYVLLAPLFGIGLRELRLGAGRPPGIVVDLGGTADELAIEEFRELVRERVRGELARSRPSSPFAIDLGAVPQAERALAAREPRRVVELLGAWPGPLSLLLRTPEGQQLSVEVKATLGRALGLLGAAYVALERHDWAEEVTRLGIQWAQETPAAAELYRRLGEAFVARGRLGEALGLLRRAQTLGADPRDTLPLLARCFAERGKWVAAAACVDRALEAGVAPERLSELRARIEATLGDRWRRFRAAVPLAPRALAAPASTPPSR
ncbi:MAG: hypothetical protein NZ898_07915 [Myxococcota bacterium]|nr:hypothetical protein [Myxococcota bacterium]MDW8363522.1 hypothetical protein [Myxococcales bacterium]